jgi:hypothetical protein
MRKSGPAHTCQAPRGTARASERWPSMDTEVKREFWMLAAIGTVMVEVPLAAIAVLLVLGH